MRKITDNTIVKVKVPKHLYEAVKARMAKVEEMKHTKEEGYMHGGKKEEGMHKMQDEAAINEDLSNMIQQIVQNVDPETLGMIATALGVTGGAAKLANMIKKEKGQPGRSTGTYTETKEEPMNENLLSAAQDIVQSLDPDTVMMILTALGVTGGAAKLANMIKKEKGQPGGSTGTYVEGDEE